jgi:L-threonylcarbamoyladenylate synthase
MKPRTADTAAIHEAALLLRQGGLVAFPTETVYGLGADARNVSAVQRIFTAKGRPANHPLIVHIADAALLDEWAGHVPEAARRLAAQFWPGPLAIILNKKPDVPLAVTGGQDTVALRVPNHPVALQLLRAFGGGVAAPSANRFCRISPTQAAHVAQELGDSVDLILDGGACQVGVESTIVDLSGGQPRLLRPGHISPAAIGAVLNAALTLPPPTTEIRAPGMMAVHYAPATATFLCPSEQWLRRLDGLPERHERVGVLAYRQVLPETVGLKVIAMPHSPVGYAQALYASLRALDSLQLDRILVEQPPQTDEWRAVNDRLGKAAVLMV